MLSIDSVVSPSVSCSALLKATRMQAEKHRCALPKAATMQAEEHRIALKCMLTYVSPHIQTICGFAHDEEELHYDHNSWEAAG